MWERVEAIAKYTGKTDVHTFYSNVLCATLNGMLAGRIPGTLVMEEARVITFVMETAENTAIMATRRHFLGEE